MDNITKNAILNKSGYGLTQAAKTAILNNSSYGVMQSEKQAIFNNSKYGQAQAAIKASSSSSTEPTKYTLSDGRVLVRYPSSSRIDFKSLFGSIGEEDDSADTLNLINSMKTTSHSLMDAYANRGKQNIGLE